MTFPFTIKENKSKLLLPFFKTFQGEHVPRSPHPSPPERWCLGITTDSYTILKTTLFDNKSTLELWCYEKDKNLPAHMSNHIAETLPHRERAIHLVPLQHMLVARCRALTGKWTKMSQFQTFHVPKLLRRDTWVNLIYTFIFVIFWFDFVCLLTHWKSDKKRQLNKS